MNLINFKKEFDPLLINFIDIKINQISTDKDFDFLVKEFKYLKKFINDGKRIRPFMAYLSYQEFGKKNNKEVLNLLIFLEIFHYFCLIHDDIMDKSLTRHGLKTINNEFSDSEAILIGDYLFAWSWEILNNFKLEHDIKQKLNGLFSEMINEVFLGQALDVNLDIKTEINNDLILKKTLFKTAGYTFSKPMLVGLILTNKYNDINISLVNNFGKNLGLAFQIQDDLLDITSDFDGKKKPLSDVILGKHTIFTNFVFDNGTKDQKDILSKYFGKNNKDVNITVLRNIFIESGAIEYGQGLINKYFIEAQNLIKDKKEFISFINLLKERRY